MTKSTFITNCEFIEVEGDMLEMHTFDQDEIVPCDTRGGEDVCRVRDVLTTRYKSRRFKRYERRLLQNEKTKLWEEKSVLIHDVYIGMDKQTQDLVGLVFEDFDTLESTVNRQHREINTLQQELDDIKSYGFFKRLKCLFTGIK